MVGETQEILLGLDTAAAPVMMGYGPLDSCLGPALPRLKAPKRGYDSD